MAIAALWGKTSRYAEFQNGILIETIDNRIAIVSKDSFNSLYYKLDDFTAALKEDCIDYAVYSKDNPVCKYPDWFIEAVQNGDIYQEDDYEDLIFYCEYGDIVMESGSVVLRNFLGQLNYMLPHQFRRYYDTLGEL